MKKSYLTAIILACVLSAGPALADYGYTSVSQIPMAVDFSVRVDFDEAGRPHVVTDYPFEETGATEMNLVYNKGEEQEVFTLNYRYPSGETRVGTRNGEMFRDDNLEEGYRMIQNGELDLDDQVYVNTSHFSAETDWILTYSTRAKDYTRYEEVTHAQSFDGMGTGGTERSVFYRAGEIESTRMVKRNANEDLLVEYDPYGEITLAYIVRYGEKYSTTYSYDLSTGLFGGHPVTELGFAEEDLKAEPLASLGSRTGTEVKVPAAPMPSGRIYGRVLGGLLAGILIGITLYYMFRRRKQDRKEKPSAETESAPGQAEKPGNAGQPVPEEPPRTMSSASR